MVILENRNYYVKYSIKLFKWGIVINANNQQHATLSPVHTRAKELHQLYFIKVVHAHK